MNLTTKRDEPTREDTTHAVPRPMHIRTHTHTHHTITQTTYTPELLSPQTHLGRGSMA